MASAEQYAQWIVDNADKRGTPEFDTVSKAYQMARNRPPMQQSDINGPDTTGASGDLKIGPLNTGLKLPVGATNFLAGAGKGITDIGQGIGQMVGLSNRQDVTEKRALDAELMKTGAGRAGEIAGQVTAAIPTAFIPGANTVLGGAAIGAGLGLAQPSANTSETLQNIGMGGAGGAAGVAIGRAVPLALGSFVAPFTKSGSEKVAGNVLREFSDGKTDEILRSIINPSPNTQSLVAGSKPTLAEVAQTPGISTLQQAVRGVSPTVDNALGQRATDNLMARTAALRGIAGTPDDLAMRENARSVLSKLFYDSADKTKIPVTLQDRKISQIMERPSLQAAWSTAEKMAREAGVTSVTSKGELTGGALHFLKMSLDDQIGAAKQAGKNTEAEFLMGTKEALQGWMEKNIPDYKMARTTYAELSKPINEMQVGKYLLDKLQPALMEGSKTPTRETAATFANALRDAPRTIKGSTGMAYENLSDVMTPDALKTVQGVLSDLQRKATSEDLAKTVGSNTAKNLASTQLMRNILGPMGLPQSWAESVIASSLARPAQFAMKGAEGRIQDVLGKAMLDPVFAAQIMQQAGPRNMGLLGQAYTKSLPAVGAGGLLAMQPR